MLNFGCVRFTKKHSDLPDSLEVVQLQPPFFFLGGGGGDLRVSPVFFKEVGLLGQWLNGLNFLGLHI